MEPKRAKRTYLGLSLLFVLLAVFLIWNLLAGSVSLSASEIWQSLLGGGEDLTQRRIIMQIRLPRMMAALILGGALSVSGYLLQTFFHNPIAGPFVLGISSGAKLAVSLVMIFLLSRGVKSSSALLIGAAFVGAMLAMGLILLISQYVDQMSLLVVCGVMIGYICSALFPLQAHSRLSARRGLRAQSGGADPGVPHGAHSALKRAFRLRDGLCRAGLLRRHRAAASDEGTVQNGGTADDDPGVLPRRGDLLPCV